MKGASAALIKNSDNQYLIVKPIYRSEWLLPGGAIEPGESPKEACRRECLEELGLPINIGEILCIECRKSKVDSSHVFRFIFDGGILSDESNIVLPESELEQYKFVDIEDVLLNVDAATKFRLGEIFNNSSIYLETVAP